MTTARWAICWARSDEYDGFLRFVQTLKWSVDMVVGLGEHEESPKMLVK